MEYFFLKHIFAPVIECAQGTYKKNPGLVEKSCTRCPDNSGHNILGSTTIRDCKCNKGYEGTPGSGSACISKCFIIDYIMFFIHKNQLQLFAIQSCEFCESECLYF